VSPVKDKKFPLLVCQEAINGLNDIEKLFIPRLVQQGKIRIVPDAEVTG
jgi:hypothetical protein